MGISVSRRTDAGRRAGWGLHPARHLRPGPARTWSSVTSARCFREVRARWPEGVRYLARRPTQSLLSRGHHQPVRHLGVERQTPQTQRWLSGWQQQGHAYFVFGLIKGTVAVLRTSPNPPTRCRSFRSVVWVRMTPSPAPGQAQMGSNPTAHLPAPAQGWWC